MHVKHLECGKTQKLLGSIIIQFTTTDFNEKAYTPSKNNKEKLMPKIKTIKVKLNSFNATIPSILFYIGGGLFIESVIRSPRTDSQEEKAAMDFW